MKLTKTTFDQVPIGGTFYWWENSGKENAKIKSSETQHYYLTGKFSGPECKNASGGPYLVKLSVWIPCADPCAIPSMNSPHDQ